MNYQKSKFSLIFRIISLVLIQAFLVMDIAWAAGGSLDITDQATESATLAPKLNLNAEEILNSYLYRVNGTDKLKEVSLANDQANIEKPGLENPGRRMFFKTTAKAAIGVAAVLTFGEQILPSQAEARDLNVELKDLVISFDKGVAQSELDKYITIIKLQGFESLYTIEQIEGKTLIRITGLFPLDAEKVSKLFNAQIAVRELGKSFKIIDSSAVWEESGTYKNMKNFADKVGEISSELGFGEIDAQDLVDLYEGITWVESKFYQWKKNSKGEIVPVRSYTNAEGVTQLIKNESVKELVRLTVFHKNDQEIMDELERMILNDREKLGKAIKAGKEFGPETANEKQFNVCDDFLAYTDPNLDAKKEEQIIRALHRKIDSNPKLKGVNLYYALAVWQFLKKRNNLAVGINRDIANSIEQMAKGLTIVRNNKTDSLVISGAGAYKAYGVEEAELLFAKEYFRFKLLYQMINTDKIADILRGDENTLSERLMEYFLQLMRTKNGNQKLGYTYLTLNWDRYRRLELRKTEVNKYEFAEKPLSYFKNNPNGFSVGLAAAASYNSGTGSVDDALLGFGNTVDKNNIPLWIKNMIGANPQNIREPINYLRVFLEDKFINTGSLTAEEQIVKTDLVLERYKRIYKAGDSLLESRELVRRNGLNIYADYTRRDGFDYNLASLIAQIAGSDYVDSFLRSHGLGKAWEDEIFNKTTSIFDILASALVNQNNPNYANTIRLQNYLAQKQFTATLAYLDERVMEFKSSEQARLAVIELAQQMAKEAQWQKTVAVAKTWVKRSAVGTAALAAAGGLAWIMKRRTQLGKQAVPAPAYSIPLRALGLMGYVTVQVFLISAKIIISAIKLLLNLSGNKKSQVRKTRSNLLADQKVVRPNRRLSQKNEFFSIANIKKIIIGATIIVALVVPFLVPSFSHATEKQSQAPPAISLVQQQSQQQSQEKFNNALTEKSKKSDHRQVNAQGEISEIKANYTKQGEALVFSNSKARERVEQVNQLIDKLFLSAFVNGELDEYITKRGTSEEAIAFAKALFFLQIADPEAYAVLKNGNVPLYMGNLYDYNGYTRGSRMLGILGKPMIFVNEKFINKELYATQSYFNIASTLAHESYHAQFDSPITIGNSFFQYNAATFLNELFSELPPNEQAAFKRQKDFIKFINIVPIEGDYFFEAWKLEQAYRGNRNQNLFLDFVGTILFNALPLFIGWLIVKFTISKDNKSKPSRRGGSGLLSNQKPLSRNRRANRFKSIILIPLIALQFSSFFVPSISQAAELMVSSMQDGVFYSAQKIPGTDVLFADVPKLNNILGYIRAMDGNDLISFGETNRSMAFTPELLVSVLNVDNITEQQAREIAGSVRQDSTLAAAALQGKVARSFVVFGKTETEAVDLTEQWNAELKAFFPEVKNPFTDKTFMQYRADSDGLLLLDAEYSVKDKFLLTIDLTDLTTRGYFQRSQEEIKEGIDRIAKQLEILHKKGKSPAEVIVVTEVSGFRPNEAEWTLSQIKNMLQELYVKPGEKVSFASTNLSKGKLWALPAIFTLTATIIGDLVSAATASAADFLTVANNINKTVATSDFTSIVISLFGFGLSVFIVKWVLRLIRSFGQNNLEKKSEIVVSSQAALEKLKKLDNDIKALFNQGKTRVVVALDGPSGAGKTTLAKYIKAVGIAGIQPDEIRVLSRDDYAVGSDYNEGNIEILKKSQHRGKLIIVEGNGIQWASQVLAEDDNYANPDIFVKITASKQLREQRLFAKGFSRSAANSRIRTASDPDSSLFDIVIEQPYNGVNVLLDSPEYKIADQVLKAYDHPALVLSRQFALDQMLSSRRRELIGYHNEHHFNELFSFFDSLIVHLPFQNKSSAEKLGRMAIYLHDLGYFYSEVQLLGLDHEQRSKAKVIDFAAENPGLLSELEVQSLIYMIDKTQLKIGDPLASEIAVDNRAYALLNKLNNQQSLDSLEQDFLNQFILTNFPGVDLNDLNNRQIIMDTIFGGKTLALADVWGQEETYLYQVALLSEEFRYDKNIMLKNNDPNAARNPAAMSNIEQVAETSGFQGFVQAMRLKFFLDSAEYPFMAMQQYLEAEQVNKEAQGQKENALITRRAAMIEKSKYIQSLIKDLTTGLDQNNNMLNLNKNTDDLEQVKQLKAFIEQGFSLGIYDQFRAEQLSSEINQENGLIQRGIDNQWALSMDAVQVEELMPTVEDALQISGLADSLSDPELAELIAAWEIKEFPAGQVIIKQGDISKDAFLLIDGDLDVFVDGYRVGQMSDGKLFGEIAAVENAPRSATVRVSSFVSSPAIIAQIPVAVFHKLFSQNGKFNGRIKKIIEQRKDNNKGIQAEEESKDGEASLKDKFEIGQLDTVVFFDVDLMRLTNQYVAKKNVNVPLAVLEAELEKVEQDMGLENAVSLRRGGDEFVLAINSQGSKQLAIEVAAKIKANVQNAKFAVASIGTENLSAERIVEIENFGCSIDKIGKHNIIIIPQEINGKTGKARVQEFLDMVNVSLEDANLSITSSWLNRPAVGNEVSFTLSIGLANTAEVENSEGNNDYEKTRNLAAQRKDKSKEIFKKLGDGHIETQSDFERSGASGESILLTEEGRKDLKEFESIQRDANLIEADQITDGFTPVNYPEVLYFSSENAARSNLQQRMDNAQFKGVIAFSLQGLDYYDKVGKIDKYQKEYYDAPGAVKDNRVDIRDFKVVNEAHGYVAGDEILARLRTGAMRFAKIFENFDVILVRGPPAGPNGFLVPKTEQARQMESAEVEALFMQYMQLVKSYFNQSGQSVVKVGHLRVLWDGIKSSDQNIGEVMERISQARAVHEYTANPEKESDAVFQYGDNIQETWMLLEEKHANQAVEQLYNLQAVWQQNKQQLDALAIEAEIFNSPNIITPQGSLLLEQNIGVKTEQSI